MMRFILSILLFVLYASVADAPSMPQQQSVDLPIAVSYGDKIVLSAHFDDSSFCPASSLMLSPRTAARYLVKTGGNGNLLPSFRYNRTNTTLKTPSWCVACSHAGRITKIFEFNHFRSALRVAYYLHTLCRLRI